MTTNYLHGVEVEEMPGGVSISTVDSSTIGLIGTLLYTNNPPGEEDKGNKGGQPTETIKTGDNQSVESVTQFSEPLPENNALDPFAEPYLVTSLKGFFAHFNKNGQTISGTLASALCDIYSQVAAKVVVAPMKSASDLDKGIALIEKASEKLKEDPKILVAPELTDSKTGVSNSAQQLTANTAIDVKMLTEKLVKSAEKLKAVALVDLIATNNTLTDITTALTGLTSSSRLYLLYPNVKVKRKSAQTIANISSAPSTAGSNDKETELERPASAFVAGLLVKSDAERGFWCSPSNYKLSNINGLAQEVAFTLGDTTCLANQLNEKYINTIIWHDGYRLWGNRSYTPKAGEDQRFQFLSVRRVADVINMSLLKNHMWAIDQNITKNLKDTLVDSANGFIRKLRLQGAIINGKCWADEEKNTEESLAAGRFYISFDFTAPYPAERITFQSYLTKDYLKEVLA